MIKAVIFDCFGVLVESTLEPYYIRHFKGESRKIEHAIELDKKANVGEISYDNFVEEMAKLAQITKEEANYFLENNPPNLALLNFIKTDLKPKFKIGLLSNAAKNWLDELFLPEQIKLFDDVLLSCEAGIAKPNPEFYKLSASHLGVKLDECVFVDDLARYCKGAEQAGMKAILYKDFKTLKSDLKSMLM